MHIGIDFDNTIVSYDSLFHKVATEEELIPSDLAPSKLAVRDYLRREGKEERWTQMQGYVYGARMDEAELYPGVIEFMRWAKKHRIVISIISHKTRFPFSGPIFDLHEAMHCWIRSHLNDGRKCLVRDVFIEPTQEDKLHRVSRLSCDWFIDDLPEVLLAEKFPLSTGKILFDPHGDHDENLSWIRLRNWNEILGHFRQRC